VGSRRRAGRSGRSIRLIRLAPPAYEFVHDQMNGLGEDLESQVSETSPIVIPSVSMQPPARPRLDDRCAAIDRRVQHP
jgi:hypothetical protein